MKVYNFGSINVDMVYRVPHLVKPGETLSSRSLQNVLGGKGANQSVALARAGVHVRHIGRIGDGDQWASKQLSESGVDISAVESIQGPSGHAIIQVEDNGENAIILHGGANQTFDKQAIEKHLADASENDWLLIQNECNALSEAFALARQHKMKIAFNPAPMDEAVARLPLEHCDILIVNETEAAMLAGSDDPKSVLARLSSRYPDTLLVMTLGADGALLQHADTHHRQSAIAVDVVDTTGAGDTFVGYFLASFIAGMDYEQCLHRGCTAAALSVMQAGATPSIPAANDVNSFAGRTQEN